MTQSNLINETRGPACCTVIGGRILYYSSLPSTNHTAFDEAKNGVHEGLVIVAQKQTEGRGRHGRDWFSPGEEGLYFSILLKPRCGIERFSLLPLVTGIGVARGIEKLGIKNVGIKWPNDVQIEGRKVAGVLVETRKIAEALTAVAGVGLNVNNREFPPGITGKATSLFLTTGAEYTNDEVLSLLLGEIERFYSDLCLGRNDGLVSELRRLDILRGRQVNVKVRDMLSGTAAGIDDEGRLILEKSDGEKIKINSGEVELVRTA